MTTTPPPVIRDTVPLSDMEPWRQEFVRSALQSELNMAAGWEPINTEPHPSKTPAEYLVSDDPTDARRAYLVYRRPDGLHFNGDVVLENMGIVPTWWMPVPVAKKAGA